MGDSSILFVTDDDLQALRNWKNLRVVTHDGIVASLTGSELSIGNSDYRKRFPQGGGGGVGVKTVKIQSVAADKFVCKDFDAEGVVTGDPFDVFPRVVAGGSGYTTTYNLTATTGTVVLEKFVAGNFIDIFASQVALRRAASGPVVAKWWTWDVFHLSSCIA